MRRLICITGTAVVLMGVSLPTACVPLLEVDGRLCPCGEGYRCVNGICQALGPPQCGDGILEPAEGEVCEPGQTDWLLGEGGMCIDCQVVCKTGWGSCDNLPDCERNLETTGSCGRCDRACRSDESICRRGVCIVEAATEVQGVFELLWEDDERLTWLTEGTAVAGVHQGDAKLSTWTKIEGLRVYENDLAQPVGGLVSSGSGLHGGYVWGMADPTTATQRLLRRGFGLRWVSR